MSNSPGALYIPESTRRPCVEAESLSGRLCRGCQGKRPRRTLGRLWCPRPPFPGPLHVCSEPDTLACSLTRVPSPRPQQGRCLSGTRRRLGAQRLTLAQTPQGLWHLRPLTPRGSPAETDPGGLLEPPEGSRRSGWPQGDLFLRGMETSAPAEVLQLGVGAWGPWDGP